MKIILASASPRRRELLKRVFKKFQVKVSAVREYHRHNDPPVRSAEANAWRKARKVSALFPNALVIGADTIVVLGEKILGKPKNLKEARRMLTRLSGRAHEVITGVALLSRKLRIEHVFATRTKVKFKTLTKTMIDHYLKSVHTLDKAGAYGIQEKPKIVKSISGSYTNVIGLPVECLQKELKAFGVQE